MMLLEDIKYLRLYVYQKFMQSKLPYILNLKTPYEKLKPIISNKLSSPLSLHRRDPLKIQFRSFLYTKFLDSFRYCSR